MEKFKNICNKITHVLQWIVGYALLVCLFAGGLGFIGFIVALCIGGEIATSICTWLYKTYYVILVKISTITTVVCFLLLYLRGDANWQNPIKYWENKIADRKAKKELSKQLVKESAENKEDTLTDCDSNEEKNR